MIDILLGLKNESNRKSCLMMAIRSARHLTGRDVDTGDSCDIRSMRTNVLMKDDVMEHCLEDEYFFAGIAMYLIAVDCVGCIFDNKEKTPMKTNGIGMALESFSSLDETKINALIDLRNTLAHNFGLATEFLRNGKPRKDKHKYTLSFSDKAEAIETPKIQWDGNFDNKDESCLTIIGVYSLCNLVEEIIANVYKCHESGNLKLRIEDNEAKARFTVITE